jgi:hypothetical protein
MTEETETQEQTKKQGAAVTPEMYEAMRKGVANELREQLKKEVEEEFFKTHGGSGVLPANLNGNFGNEGGSAIPSGAHEFDSYEEMVEWARLNDRKTYDALKSKSAKAISENKNYWEWTDHFDEEGNSLIGRTLHKQNAQKRNRK